MPEAITAGGPDKLGRVEDEEVKPYVIVSNLGKGSFAIVYKGYHSETHKEVAIKTIKRSGLNRKLLDNLQSEIDILKSLSHRHITKLINIINAEHNIYLIMEYCAGGDLTNYIKKRGRVEGLEYIPGPGMPPQYYPHPRTGGLDEIVVRSFLRQLARALRFLRQRNLIHRDIKPQNLLLNPPTPEESARGHPLGVPILKVADFGFARSLPNAMMAETLCGSPLYMAPEILSYKHYDAKVDLWSVGAVLYEMATGKPPFRAQNHIELLNRIERSKGIKFPDEDPSLQGSDDVKPVPPDVKELIRRLLKREPIERCSFEEFFGSTALAKSKFPRPGKTTSSSSGVKQTPSNEPWPSDERAQPAPDPVRPIPPEVLDPKVIFPPSKFNFKRREATDGQSPTSSHTEPVISPAMERAPCSASNNSPQRRPQFLRPLSTEGSMIPGETEEDGLLRREYVLVDDTRAVEFNRAVDEISGLRRKPLPARDNRAPLSPLTDVGANVPYPMDNATPPTSDITFPPPPNYHSPPLSASPTSAASRAATNALSRALSIASKKLFGTGNGTPRSHGYQDYSPSTSSPRRQQIILPRSLDDEAEPDPLEKKILTELDHLAQKTEVLTRWADELYEYVKAVPQKPLPDPSKFVKREGEADKLAAKRRNADLEAENNAITSIAVYMLVMSFSQKGIDQLRTYQEHMKMRDPDGEFLVSEGFLDALSWFKEGFIRCNDRVTLVKTWLPAQYDGPRMWLDHLVYDRALMLSRTAARKELLDQASSPDECKQLYEESIWLLYTLQDDLLQTGNPFVEEDRATVATWITRTRLRLHRCQDRMGMNDRDRLKDARADQNLDDVPRIPPPWETPANVGPRS
ncbi:kinase-like protein [Neolentinus lepideus HHB14362 ss-1]|uniref:non-specific serine/threonine protein kinase n=1 Tax=Neolentinus lepideus HHB14362 ss-1 TaxID=1314782 RepID=A0A165T1H2_9AGAM|nr:kinase-like protein [Neolentinus lepideus HHB14362 ss-1]